MSCESIEMKNQKAYLYSLELAVVETVFEQPAVVRWRLLQPKDVAASFPASSGVSQCRLFSDSRFVEQEPPSSSIYLSSQTTGVSLYLAYSPASSGVSQCRLFSESRVVEQESPSS
ncbi:hypothetical protein Ddye_025983 [Dipteronia dyeriana]|uniref:Uncharacterized protein n=1 Tax=Dipteronia dyeriana TaxID=168575 RepID=A0AAD9TLT1_9ROSI|nr:hypothetical protein Ddye_025983 [Dipteronia dyeriana]